MKDIRFFVFVIWQITKTEKYKLMYKPFDHSHSFISFIIGRWQKAISNAHALEYILRVYYAIDKLQNINTDIIWFWFIYYNYENSHSLM